MNRFAARLTAVVVSSLVVAGCSSSKGHATTSSSNSQSGSPTSGAPSSPASIFDGESAVTVQDIERVLLTASDISPTATAAKAPTVENPLPCAASGSPSLNQRVPAKVRSGVDISDDTSHTAVSEEIRVYQDIATAVRALSTAKAGLACATGELRANDGTKLKVSIKGPGTDVEGLKQDPKLAEVPIGQAVTWSVTSTDGEEFVFAAMQVGPALVLMDFVAATKADESNLTDPQVLMQRAIEKASA